MFKVKSAVFVLLSIFVVSVYANKNFGVVKTNTSAYGIRAPAAWHYYTITNTTPSFQTYVIIGQVSGCNVIKHVSVQKGKTVSSAFQSMCGASPLGGPFRASTAIVGAPNATSYSNGYIHPPIKH